MMGNEMMGKRDLHEWVNYRTSIRNCPLMQNPFTQPLPTIPWVDDGYVHERGIVGKGDLHEWVIYPTFVHVHPLMHIPFTQPLSAISLHMGK